MNLFPELDDLPRRYSREECAELAERYAHHTHHQARSGDGRWVTLEEGQHVYIKGGKFYPSGPGSVPEKSAEKETVGGRKPELMHQHGQEIVGSGRKTQITRATEDEIPRDVAERAHSGTSFVPERRGEQVRKDYVDTLNSDYEELSKLASTDAEKKQLDDEFARYKEGYKKHLLDLLHAKSRVASSMITGPARFPVESNRKKGDTADRRLNELLDFRKKAMQAIRSKLKPEDHGIKTADPNAGSLIAKKIAALEKKQELYKKINDAHAKFLKDQSSLDDSDLSDDTKKLIRNYKPEYSWEPHPIAPYQLKNNNAEIRRLKGRVEDVETLKASEHKEEKYGDVSLVENPELGRIQIKFPGKPDEKTRSALKSAGFRWAPSEGSWQRHLNNGGRYAAERVLKELGKEKSDDSTEKNQAAMIPRRYSRAELAERYATQWDESQHPRDGGKFTESPGGGPEAKLYDPPTPKPTQVAGQQKGQTQVQLNDPDEPFPQSPTPANTGGPQAKTWDAPGTRQTVTGGQTAVQPAPAAPAQSPAASPAAQTPKTQLAPSAAPKTQLAPSAAPSAAPKTQLASAEPPAVQKQGSDSDEHDYSDHDFDAASAAKEQDWHSQYMAQRWGKNSVIHPSEHGHAKRAISGLMNPKLGGENYAQKLLAKHGGPPADPATVSSVQQAMNSVKPGSGTPGVAAVATKLYGQQAVPILQQLGSKQGRAGAQQKIQQAQQAVASGNHAQVKQHLQDLGAPPEVVAKADQPASGTGPKGQQYKNAADQYLDQQARKIKAVGKGAATGERIAKMTPEQRLAHDQKQGEKAAGKAAKAAERSKKFWDKKNKNQADESPERYTLFQDISQQPRRYSRSDCQRIAELADFTE